MSFKFFNMRANHENFMQIVKSSWDGNVEGSPMFRLVTKLKRFKIELKELNKKEF